jgi:hypothetical protein
MAENKKPTYDVSWKVPATSDSPEHWRVAGRAWREKDGKIILRLGGLPFAGWDGSFVLFPHKEQKGDDQ